MKALAAGALAVKTAAAAVLVLVAGAGPSALAFAPDGCELQRADYPKRWNDVSREKTLLTCTALGASGSRRLTVRIGAADRQGRTPMSVAVAGRKPKLYRMWLDREQAERLKKGEYFASVLRPEEACWIRSLSEDTPLLFVDNATGASEDAPPRVSMFGDAAFTCVRKPAAAPAALTESCERQRAQFPTDWTDVSNAKPLFDCAGRGFAWRVRLGEPDGAGRSMLSLVSGRYATDGGELEENASQGVYRAWLDADQAARLKQGQYFAAPVRGEDSCWRDGTLKDGELLLIDTAESPQDRPDFGSFYNKAPRFSLFGDFMQCKPAKAPAAGAKPD